LTRLGIDGDEGGVIGKVVSVVRRDTRAAKSGAGDGTGGGSELIGVAGMLATRFVGISSSDVGGEGVWMGGEHAGWARRTQTGLCSGASCTGLGEGLGLATPRRAFGK
jgi:hypothetical protein